MCVASIQDSQRSFDEAAIQAQHEQSQSAAEYVANDLLNNGRYLANETDYDLDDVMYQAFEDDDYLSVSKALLTAQTPAETHVAMAAYKALINRSAYQIAQQILN